MLLNIKSVQKYLQILRLPSEGKHTSVNTCAFTTEIHVLGQAFSLVVKMPVKIPTLHTENYLQCSSSGKHALWEIWISSHLQPSSSCLCGQHTTEGTECALRDYCERTFGNQNLVHLDFISSTFS